MGVNTWAAWGWHGPQQLVGLAFMVGCGPQAGWGILLCVCFQRAPAPDRVCSSGGQVYRRVSASRSLSIATAAACGSRSAKALCSECCLIPAVAAAAAAAAAAARCSPGGGVIGVVGWRASLIMHLAGAATWFYLAGRHSRLAVAENCLQQRWMLPVF